MNVDNPLQISIPHTLTLPIRNCGNIPFLQCTLDGNAHWILLDSGAPDMMLHSGRIPEEQLTVAGELLGASGKLKSFTTVFGKLEIGSWTIGPREVRALDQTHIEKALEIDFIGLLGFRQLIHSDWLLDYGNMELRLWTAFKRAEHAVKSELKIQYRNHLPIFPVTIAGQEFHLLLDTGADGLVFDIDKQSLIEGEMDELNTSHMQGASDTTVEVKKGTLSQLTVSELEFENITTAFSDISQLKSRIGEFDGIIGYPIFSNCRLVVSWEQKRFFFLENE